ncbi:MAG: glycosyltransferase family 4 protein [Solirubrobacterales bacterium]
MSAAEIRVAQVGPDPSGKGGMAAVTRDLLDSPLAQRHRLEPIVTWRGFQPAARLWVFCSALISLAVWCLRPGKRIVHVHTAVRGSLYRKSICVFLVKLLRRPVILHVHAGPGDIDAFAAALDPLRRLFFRRALRAANGVLAVSSESARSMERGLGARDVVVIPNAAPDVDAALADRAAPDCHVLFLGGFANPIKGGEALVSALELCADEIGDAVFELAGPGDPSPALLALSERSQNVRWVGWLDEEGKRAALERCALFVLPSLSEGLPVAMLEAMAWGRPIVATRVGGVPDVVSDGVEARIVPPGDPEALAEAIRQMVGDPEEAWRLGRAARRRALSLNEDEVCGRLDSLYRELVA